jgi:hypothetical protein
MNRLSPIPTTPSSLKEKGYGMDTRPLWLCGHQHRHGKGAAGCFTSAQSARRGSGERYFAAGAFLV